MFFVHFQQFKGKFYYCFGVDPYTVENKTECIEHSTGRWVNYQYNFDNLLEVSVGMRIAQ